MQVNENINLKLLANVFQFVMSTQKLLEEVQLGK